MRNTSLKIIFGAFLFNALVVGMTACNEVNPIDNVNPIDTTGGTDTSLANQQKNVLLEDFTGVHCPNCPAAHDIAQLLIDNNPERVEVVAIHSGVLAVPYPGEGDLRIPQGQDIDDHFGPADFYPMGAIDQKIHDPQTQVLVGRELWNGLVAQSLTETLLVKIGLTKNYNAATRQLDLDVALHYLSDVTDAQKITVMMTESGLNRTQEFPDSVSTGYIHNHVLRGMLTDAIGDPVNATTTAGSVVNKSFSTTLPADWVADNCRVVVFVSRDAASQEVLQVKGIEVE